MTIRQFALTYPQLMSEAMARGVEPKGLAALRRTYETAERLFDGFYRGHGTPFLCHVVRTAGILLAERQPVDIVCAGLVHAAYERGRFDDQQNGKATPAHRAQLQEELGAAVEDLVLRYSRLPWYSADAVTQHLQQLSTSSSHADVLVIRLANELEDYLDLGMAYRGATSFREAIASYGDGVVELARQLKRFQLAIELRGVFDEHMACRLPEAVVHHNRSSYEQPMRKWLEMGLLERLQARLKGVRSVGAAASPTRRSRRSALP